MDQRILDLIKRGAIFYVNDSGGKDSQAMKILINEIVPREQIRIVHAVLPDVEWDGVEEHIDATSFGHRIYKCRSRRTLLQMIEERGMFPSPQQRQCTSDLKRGPIERTIRGIIRDEKLSKIVVNCMGMRAQESTSRKKLAPFKFSERNSKAGREWYDWLPIHDKKVEWVFATIENAGQKPHWAYAAGMSRLSCCFCIMSSKEDLTTAAHLNPKLYKRYVELERSTGQVMMMPKKVDGVLKRETLEDITGVRIDG
jgi:3'-phosphoadenosine 5'-phosphosulfate sulfotransferase (PAPS reductase)/FAD synthetase